VGEKECAQMQSLERNDSRPPDQAKRLLDRINEMLTERPGERAHILRRLKQTDPGLYSEWLIQAAVDAA
jgi:hypothetical protein